jgi:hypothetical protein
MNWTGLTHDGSNWRRVVNMGIDVEVLKETNKRITHERLQKWPHLKKDSFPRI